MLSGLVAISEVRHLFPLAKVCFLSSDSSHVCEDSVRERLHTHAKCKMAFDSVQSSVSSAGCQE